MTLDVYMINKLFKVNSDIRKKKIYFGSSLLYLFYDLVDQKNPQKTNMSVWQRLDSTGLAKSRFYNYVLEI